MDIKKVFLKRLVNSLSNSFCFLNIYGSLNPGTSDNIDGISLHSDNCLYKETSSSSVGAFIFSPKARGFGLLAEIYG